MITRKARPTSNFYILSNDIAGDRELTWEARGMLIFLLTKQDNWKVSIQNLINETKNAIGKAAGRDKIYAIINQLVEAGYVTKQQTREPETGRMAETEYFVSEVKEKPASGFAVSGKKSPLTDLPYTDMPYTDMPLTANPIQVITNSKQVLNKENTERESAAQSAASHAPDSFSKKDSSGGEVKHRKSKTSVDDWTMTDDDVQFAASQGCTKETIINEYTKFKNWHLANGYERADWSATWRNWVLRIADFGKNNTTAHTTGIDACFQGSGQEKRQPLSLGDHLLNALESVDDSLPSLDTVVLEARLQRDNYKNTWVRAIGKKIGYKKLKTITEYEARQEIGREYAIAKQFTSTKEYLNHGNATAN